MLEALVIAGLVAAPFNNWAARRAALPAWLRERRTTEYRRGRHAFAAGLAAGAHPVAVDHADGVGGASRMARSWSAATGGRRRMASRKVTAAVTARPAPRRESAALWVRRMSGRDPAEEHRSSTRLELLFDLTFVIAVARAAIELRDALGHGHAGHALAGYSMVFFGLWWAWVNFTWFASAYDTDDVPYRLLTLLQMAGVLVFAAGIPAAFEHFDFVVVVVGYVIMRMALVAQWLRAARGHPEGRAGTLRYAAGITGIQLCWIGWLAGHIADRYGGFTIIVLGEVIAAIATAVNDTVTGSQASPGLLTVAAAGLVLVFALWWSYFWSSSWPCCWPTTSRKAGPRTHSGRSLPLKARGGASDSPGAGCRVGRAGAGQLTLAGGP